MQEARDTLAEILELTERRMQIITIMQRVVICRTPDTRRFLADAMAGLIEGGLEYMRRKRREAIEAIQRKNEEERRRRKAEEESRQAAARKRDEEQRATEEKIRAAIEAKRAAEEAKRRAAEPEFETMEVFEEAPAAAPPPPPPPAIPEPVPGAQTTAAILPSPEELREIEELGTELDALSLAAVAREIYPDLKNQYEPWEVGRAIYMDEAAAREAVLQGARLKDHERATMLAPALDNMKRLIENRKPWWAGSLPAIRECIDAHFAVRPEEEGGATAQHLFEVIAMSDERAVRMLELIAKTNEPGIEYVADVRRKLEKLMAIEEKRAT